MSISPDDVTAVIVTRGNVPLDEILASLIFPHVKVWDNSRHPDLGAFGRYVAAAAVETPYVYFQDDDLIVLRPWQERLLAEYEDGHLVTNMPTDDYRAPGTRTYMHHLVWQGWGSVCATAQVMESHARWLAEGESIDKDYLIVGGDVIFGTLMPWKRLDIDAGRSTGLHGQERPRTSAMPDDYQRKMRFYVRAVEILGAEDIEAIRLCVANELRSQR